MSRRTIPFETMFDDDWMFSASELVLREEMALQRHLLLEAMDTYGSVEEVLQDLGKLDKRYEFEQLWIVRHTRFTPDEMLVLLQHFNLKRTFRTRMNDYCSGAVALLFVCRRLFFSVEFYNLEWDYRIDSTVINRICREAVQHIMELYKDLILMHPALSHRPVQDHFVRRVAAKTGVDSIHIIGFMDNNVMNAYKAGMRHKIKGSQYQWMYVPSGIVASLYGPLEGRQLPVISLGRSKILLWLERYAKHPDGSSYSIYADSTYPSLSQLASAYSGSVMSVDKRAFHNAMRKVRTSVG